MIQSCSCDVRPQAALRRTRRSSRQRDVGRPLLIVVAARCRRRPPDRDQIPHRLTELAWALLGDPELVQCGDHFIGPGRWQAQPAPRGRYQLPELAVLRLGRTLPALGTNSETEFVKDRQKVGSARAVRPVDAVYPFPERIEPRSEERRVGKGGRTGGV